MTEYSRIMRFRNSRVAKYFAVEHGGTYMGWVDGDTTFKITRGNGLISSKDKGCYIVIWE